MNLTSLFCILFGSFLVYDSLSKKHWKTTLMLGAVGGFLIAMGYFEYYK